MGTCVGRDHRETNQSNKSRTTIELDPLICESLINDSIFRTESNASQLVKELLKHIQVRNSSKSKINIQRIFRASEHRFKASAFHQHCHNKSNTIVIVRTGQNRIYGGYSPCSWIKDESYSYEEDQKAISFLFTVKDSKVQVFQINEKQKAKAIMNNSQSGPIFGEGHDLYISDECDKRECWNNIGKTYKTNFRHGSQKSNKQLSGQQRHKIKDYEVWEIV